MEAVCSYLLASDGALNLYRYFLGVSGLAIYAVSWPAQQPSFWYMTATGVWALSVTVQIMGWVSSMGTHLLVIEVPPDLIVSIVALILIHNNSTIH